MFTIWYTAFAWNEYRDTIIRRLQQYRGIAPTNTQTTAPNVPETPKVPETKSTGPPPVTPTPKPITTPPVPSKPQPIPQTPPTRPIKQLSPSPPPPPKKKPSPFGFEKKFSSESSESDSSPSPNLRGKNDAFNMKKSSPKFKNSDVVDFLSKEIDASFPQPNPPKQKSPPKKVDAKLSTHMQSVEVFK
ncbi:proline-rich receptor-like protein kinase PERK2 [Chrysoperla carnea]|uniref:proline-rich receptor-like protein kinase PERK2 n=1 Tax=Chrysoperla carnea TaxID=189513 RepID=UPI001D0864B4|nr:proline-rich receptor-like protein kinase PERK2 [Chrysoperla carnea]